MIPFLPIGFVIDFGFLSVPSMPVPSLPVGQPNPLPPVPENREVRLPAPDEPVDLCHARGYNASIYKITGVSYHLCK